MTDARMVSTEKRPLAKTVRRRMPASKKSQGELQALRATVMRLKRDHVALKREVATVVAEVSGALRPIDAAFDEHDRQVMSEFQEGITEYTARRPPHGK